MKEQFTCPRCRGNGDVVSHHGMIQCENCGGTGKLTDEIHLLDEYAKKCFAELGMSAENPHNVLRWCFNNPPNNSKCVHSWFKNEEASVYLWKCTHCGTTIQIT